MTSVFSSVTFGTVIFHIGALQKNHVHNINGSTIIYQSVNRVIQIFEYFRFNSFMNIAKNMYTLVQKERDSEIRLYLQQRADWIKNFRIQSTSYHFPIEICHCLSNNSIHHVFFLQIKNKSQTPLHHALLFTQSSIRA